VPLAAFPAPKLHGSFCMCLWLHDFFRRRLSDYFFSPCCSAEAPAASFFLNSLSQRDSRQDSRSHPLVADAASVKTTTKPHVCGADRNSLVLGGLISRWG
jgi:hypothetical protein